MNCSIFVFVVYSLWVIFYLQMKVFFAVWRGGYSSGGGGRFSSPSLLVLSGYSLRLSH